MDRKIVVFGASGYTGALVTRALLRHGLRPMLAGRSEPALRALADELGGLEWQLADAGRPASLRALLNAGDVLLTTVGPFARLGQAALDAALAAGACYIDSTGEPQFIRQLYQQYDSAARLRGVPLLTACGFDWVPGNLAAELALQQAGPSAQRVDVGYFSPGGAISGGTRASIAGVLLAPSHAFRDGELRIEACARSSRSFDCGDGRRWAAVSVGGSEHLNLPRRHPTLRDVGVYIGMPNAERISRVARLVALALRSPGVRPALELAAASLFKGSSGGPDAAERARSASLIVAEAFDAQSRPLARVRLQGVNGYGFTAEFLALLAAEALSGGVSGVGVLSPQDALGLSRLQAAVAEAGLRLVE